MNKKDNMTFFKLRFNNLLKAKKCAYDRDNSGATAAQILELSYSACKINKNLNAHFLL